MHPSKEEAEIRSKVLFYSASTVVYIPILLLVLVWTGWIYLAGNEKFNLVSSLVLLGELVKPFFGTHYFNSLHVKRSEERVLAFKSQPFLKLSEGVRTVAVVISMILVYFFAAVVYGANIFEKYESTFIFSGLLTALTIVPVALNLGTTSVLPLLLGTKPTSMMETLLSQNLYLSVLGAWLGAFVIPLDWDRPWQAWPIPCVFGMLFGYTLSHLVMLCRLGLKTRKKNRRNI